MNRIFLFVSVLWFWSASTLGLTAPARAIHLVQIVPPDRSNYIVGSEFQEIRKAADLAVAEFSKRKEHCETSVSLDLRVASQEEHFEKIQQISSSKSKTVVVGFSRSGQARVAAKAAAGSPVIGISIGSATDTLRGINPNFVSLSMPWQYQWARLKQEFSGLGCNAENTAGIFEPIDIYSRHFREAFTGGGYTRTYETSIADESILEKEELKKYKCIFIGTNFAVAQRIISKLIGASWRGPVFGTGDWFYFSSEIKKMIASLPPNTIRIIAPTSAGASSSVLGLKQKNRLKEIIGKEPDPVSVGTYDGMLIGLYYLCGRLNPLNASANELNKLGLMRVYSGISNTGNYLSEMKMIENGTIIR